MSLDTRPKVALFTCGKCGSTEFLPPVTVRADTNVPNAPTGVLRLWCPTCNRMYVWHMGSRTWEEDHAWRERMEWHFASLQRVTDR